MFYMSYGLNYSANLSAVNSIFDDFFVLFVYVLICAIFVVIIWFFLPDATTPIGGCILQPSSGL